MRANTSDLYNTSIDLWPTPTRPRSSPPPPSLTPTFNPIRRQYLHAKRASVSPSNWWLMARLQAISDCQLEQQDGLLKEGWKFFKLEWFRGVF